MQKNIRSIVAFIAGILIMVPVARASSFSTSTPFTVGSTTSSVPTFIVSDAGVGVGTASPISTFHIEGSMPALTIKKKLVNQSWQLRTGGFSQFASGFDLYNESAKKTALYVSTDGNLSIGTSSTNLNSRLYVWGGPTGANIDVRGDDRIYGGDQATIELEGHDYEDNEPNSALLQYYGSNGVGSTMGFPNTNLGHVQFGNNSVGIIHTNNTAPLVFGTNNAERMRIAGNGNVGVGTTNPQSILQIVAPSTATTTITIGDLIDTNSKSCVNMKTTAGAVVSFYFDATGQMVVEQNPCK